MVTDKVPVTTHLVYFQGVILHYQWMHFLQQMVTLTHFSLLISSAIFLKQTHTGRILEVRWFFKCFRILAMITVTLMHQLLTSALNQMNDHVFLSCQSDLDWSLCWLHDSFLSSGEFRKTTYAVDPPYLLHLLELHPCWLPNTLHSSVVMKEILTCCLL